MFRAHYIYGQGFPFSCGLSLGLLSEHFIDGVFTLAWGKHKSPKNYKMATTSYEKSGYDLEYQPEPLSVGEGEKHRSIVVPDASGAVHGESFVTGNTLYARLQRLAGRFGVEQRGIERVPEDERTDKSTLKVGTMVRLFGMSLRESSSLTVDNSGALPTWWFRRSRSVSSRFPSLISASSMPF